MCRHHFLASLKLQNQSTVHVQGLKCESPITVDLMELLAMATNAEEEELAGEAWLSGATMTNDGDTEGRLEKS
jgi:hypothetical protein